MGRVDAWKQVLERGGLISLNEAVTILLGEEDIIYQMREALNKILYPREVGKKYTYAEILKMIDDVVVKLQSGVEIGILDLLESDAVEKRVSELVVVLTDVLYKEKWLG